MRRYNTKKKGCGCNKVFSDINFTFLSNRTKSFSTLFVLLFVYCKSIDNINEFVLTYKIQTITPQKLNGNMLLNRDLSEFSR